MITENQKTSMSTERKELSGDLMSFEEFIAKFNQLNPDNREKALNLLFELASKDKAKLNTSEVQP